MNTRGRAPVALFVGLMLVLASSAVTAQESAQEGAAARLLYLHSDPMYAQIFVNGELRDVVTPEPIALEPREGPYEIVLQKAGYRPAVMTVGSDGEWPRGIEVDLEREELVLRFEGINAVSLGSARRDASDVAIISPLGRYELSRSRDGLTVERVYPHEPLRRAAGWAVPALLAVTGISLIDDVIEPRGSLYTSPATLAAAGLSVVSGGVFIGLSVDKLRYHTEAPRFMQQDTRPDADDDLFGRAEQAFRLGAFEEALEGFEGLVERYPESGRVPEALRNIGEIYRILRSPQTALVFLREIPQRYPAPSQLNPALLSVSEVALETGDRGQAFTALEQIRLSLGGVTEKQFLLQRVAVGEAELADQGRSARLLNSLRHDYTRLMELATDSEEASEYRQRIEALESKENGD